MIPSYYHCSCNAVNSLCPLWCATAWRGVGLTYVLFGRRPIFGRGKGRSQGREHRRSPYYYYPDYARFLIHPSAFLALPFGSPLHSFFWPPSPSPVPSVVKTVAVGLPPSPLSQDSQPFTHSNFATLGVHALALCVCSLISVV